MGGLKLHSASCYFQTNRLSDVIVFRVVPCMSVSVGGGWVGRGVVGTRGLQ